MFYHPEYKMEMPVQSLPTALADAHYIHACLNRVAENEKGLHSTPHSRYICTKCFFFVEYNRLAKRRMKRYLGFAYVCHNEVVFRSQYVQLGRISIAMTLFTSFPLFASII